MISTLGQSIASQLTAINQGGAAAAYQAQSAKARQKGLEKDRVDRTNRASALKRAKLQLQVPKKGGIGGR